MSVAKKPDKGDALIRALAAKPSNKYCFNCLKPGTQRSVCLTLGTFICDQCAGRQRGLPGFQTGTISARTFTEKEAAVFERNGNKRLRKVWFGALDDEKLKALIATLGEDGKRWAAHMSDVYVSKRYYKEPAAPGAAAEGKAAVEAPGSVPGTRSRGQSGAGASIAAPATERRPSAAPAPAAAGGAAAPVAAPATAPSGKATAAAAAAAPKPAPVPEVDLLSDLAADLAPPVPAEALGKPEKKSQSKALPPDPEPDDGFDPFAATPHAQSSGAPIPASPAPAAIPNGVHHSSPAPAPGGPGSVSSPMPPVIKALRDCLTTVQTRGNLTLAQLRTYTLQALDEMAKAAAPTPAPAPAPTPVPAPAAHPANVIPMSTATLQPGMPAPAHALPFGGVATPFAAAVNGTGSANSTLQPGMPSAAQPSLNRLPSLTSLMGPGSWGPETAATPAAPVPAARPAVAPAPAAAAANNNPFAFGDDDAPTGGGDNPFAFGEDVPPAAAAPAPAVAAAKRDDNPFGGDGGFTSDPFAAPSAPAARPAAIPPRSNTGPTISATAFPPVTPQPAIGAAGVLSPFGVASPPVGTGVSPASSMASPFGGPGITPTPVTSPFGAAAAAPAANPLRPPLAPQFLQMLMSNPAFLQQFVQQFGYDPVAEANAAAAAAAAPVSMAAAPPSNAFISSGPLAGIQPLAVKSAKPAEPAAPPKPDLFADFNPLK